MVTVLRAWPKPVGARIEVEHGGAHFLLYRRDWREGDPLPSKDWATDVLLKMQADRDAVATEEQGIADAIKDAGWATFEAWLRANYKRPDLRPLLKKLARLYYREELA